MKDGRTAVKYFDDMTQYDTVRRSILCGAFIRTQFCFGKADLHWMEMFLGGLRRGRGGVRWVKKWKGVGAGALALVERW